MGKIGQIHKCLLPKPPHTHTVFTWLNAVATITLVQKIDAATIQIRPLRDTRKRFLNP